MINRRKGVKIRLPNPEHQLVNNNSPIKLKNSEGDDRIPQRILIDGVEILLETQLVSSPESMNKIPYQNNDIFLKLLCKYM